MRATAHLTVRIGNGGAAVAGLGVPVTFYDGDPAAGSPRLGTVLTSAAMASGAFEDVVLRLPAAATTSRSIWIAADDDGNLHGMTTESNEDNNVYDSGQALVGPSAGVDLVVTDVDAAGIVTDPETLVVSGTVRATIRNQGDAPATGAFAVAFFEDTDADGAYDPGLDVLLGQAVHAAGLGAREEAVADGIGERRRAVRGERRPRDGRQRGVDRGDRRDQQRRRARPPPAASCRRWGCSHPWSSAAGRLRPRRGRRPTSPRPRSSPTSTTTAWPISSS